jgi:hypothetical protein
VEQKDHQDQPMSKKPKMVSFEKESIEKARYAIYLHRHAARLKDDHLEHQSNNSLDQKSVFVNNDPILKDNKLDIPNQNQLQDNVAYTRASTIIETTFPVMFRGDVMDFINAFSSNKIHTPSSSISSIPFMMWKNQIDTGLHKNLTT